MTYFVSPSALTFRAACPVSAGNMAAPAREKKALKSPDFPALISFFPLRWAKEEEER